MWQILFNDLECKNTVKWIYSGGFFGVFFFLEKKKYFGGVFFRN